MQITFTIAAVNVTRIINAIEDLYPIPIDPATIEDPIPTPLFTSAQWAKEWLRLHVIATVKRSETKTAKDVAEASVTVPDDIIT